MQADVRDAPSLPVQQRLHRQCGVVFCGEGPSSEEEGHAPFCGCWCSGMVVGWLVGAGGYVCGRINCMAPAPHHNTHIQYTSHPPPPPTHTTKTNNTHRSMRGSLSSLRKTSTQMEDPSGPRSSPFSSLCVCMGGGVEWRHRQIMRHESTAERTGRHPNNTIATRASIHSSSTTHSNLNKQESTEHSAARTGRLCPSQRPSRWRRALLAPRGPRSCVWGATGTRKSKACVCVCWLVVIVGGERRFMLGASDQSCGAKSHKRRGVFDCFCVGCG
jgi:hypothetical protein